MEQRRPPVSKRYETKVRMVWGSFLIAGATLKTPTRNGYNAQGVNLTFYDSFPPFTGPRARCVRLAKQCTPGLTLFQYYCTTIGQYTTPPRPSLCMEYTVQDRQSQ